MRVLSLEESFDRNMDRCRPLDEGHTDLFRVPRRCLVFAFLASTVLWVAMAVGIYWIVVFAARI